METELDKAKRLIRALIDAINVMPVSWDEFVGEDLADEVKEFLGEKDDEEDEEYEDDEE